VSILLTIHIHVNLSIVLAFLGAETQATIPILPTKASEYAEEAVKNSAEVDMVVFFKMLSVGA
jgi:hypothetical protein